MRSYKATLVSPFCIIEASKFVTVQQVTLCGVIYYLCNVAICRCFRCEMLWCCTYGRFGVRLHDVSKWAVNSYILGLVIFATAARQEVSECLLHPLSILLIHQKQLYISKSLKSCVQHEKPTTKLCQKDLRFIR